MLNNFRIFHIVGDELSVITEFGSLVARSFYIV